MTIVSGLYFIKVPRILRRESDLTRRDGKKSAPAIKNASDMPALASPGMTVRTTAITPVNANRHRRLYTHLIALNILR